MQLRLVTAKHLRAINPACVLLLPLVIQAAETLLIDAVCCSRQLKSRLSGEVSHRGQWRQPVPSRIVRDCTDIRENVAKKRHLSI